MPLLCCFNHNCKNPLEEYINIVNRKEPKITKSPVILEIFSSKPKPTSQNQCLISLKIWKEKDHVSPRIKNLPINELKNKFMNS